MEEEPPMTAPAIASPTPAPAASDWRVWLDQHGPRLLLFARQQTRSHEDAEDILQEAIVKLVDKIQTNEFVGGMESWQAYLYTTIRRLAIDLSRRDDRRRRREDIVTLDAEAFAASTDPWFETDSSDDETRSQLESKLRELPEKFAEVIIMKIWGERTFAEIAETLGISQNTAASRYRYGLEALKKSLGTARRRGDLSI
jgi:RNA polymerase sigma-70 factor (ECF subfamily)